MLQFFSQVADFFGMIGEFILNIVTGVVQLISMYATFGQFFNTISAAMPPVFIAFISLGLALSVLFMVMGRS